MRTLSYSEHYPCLFGYIKLVWGVHVFYYKQHFYKQRHAKYQVNDKEHLKTEILLFENYSHSPSSLSSKNKSTYSKKQTKERMCLYFWDYIINHNEYEDENEE